MIVHDSTYEGIPCGLACDIIRRSVVFFGIDRVLHWIFNETLGHCCVCDPPRERYPGAGSETGQSGSEPRGGRWAGLLGGMGRSTRRAGGRSTRKGGRGGAGLEAVVGEGRIGGEC